MNTWDLNKKYNKQLDLKKVRQNLQLEQKSTTNSWT